MGTYEEHPIVMWELTRACDLHCRNCTIGATEKRSPNELTTYEAYKTIDQIASLAPREVIITGGDPLERDDVGQIVNYARRRGLDPALVASPTSQLTADAMARLSRNGLNRIIFSLDGSIAALHHAVQGAIGTFSTTIQAMRWAENVGLEIEVNTLITRRNANDLAGIANLIRSVPVIRWNLYFLVPMNVAAQGEMLLAAEAEHLFAEIDDIREREEFSVRVVEAPQYRRYRLQRNLDARLGNAAAGQWTDFSGYESEDAAAPHELLDTARNGANGFVFISHAGDVRASEFLLFSAGNLRYRPLGSIYRGSDLFVALRDPANLEGKCGHCEFRHICGGSRARAWAVNGNVFADDPLCAYHPGAAPRHPRKTGGLLMSDPFHPRATPWRIDDSEFYELESVDEQMRFLLRYAVLAPSGHNTQPWMFRITKDGVEVFADYSRRLLVVDPEDRELLMSVGAAITNFRVAAAHFGFDTSVLYERRPEERVPVALVSVCETCAPDRNLAALFRAIPKRHTNRAPFDGEPIEPRRLAWVCDVIERFPETLRLIPPHDNGRIARMIEQADRKQLARPAFRAETADWIRPDDAGHSDGLRADTLGIPALLTGGASWLLRHFDAGAWQAPRDRRLAESASALLLVTADDDRVSLIRAGEALEILLLTIADAGLQYSFLNQPIAIEVMREALRTLAGASQPAQLLVRIGSAPPVEQAMPRREMDGVVARG